MARAPFLRTYTKVVPANGQVGPLALGGTRFVCKESDGIFDVHLDDVGPNECEVGVGFKFEDEEGKSATFRNIRLVNNSATPITVKFWVGTAAVLDSRLNTLVNRTVIVSQQNAATFSNGTVGVVSGSPAIFVGYYFSKLRKCITIFNKETAASGLQLVVVGNNGIEMHRIDGRQGYVIETGGVVTIYGVDAADVGAVTKFTCAEVFYA